MKAQVFTSTVAPLSAQRLVFAIDLAAIRAGDVEDFLLGLAVLVEPALHDLDALQRRGVRVAHRHDEEVRLAVGLADQIGAHGARRWRRRS